MTENRTLYFENKYKLFIRVWQTSDSITEVRMRLHDEHGWFEGMESPRLFPVRTLSTACVRSYARRLQKKGIQLKQLPHLERILPPHWSVNYKMLSNYAQKWEDHQ